MKVNTVLLPIKEKRFNPLSQREELVETGAFQEYAAGKPIGAPIRMPQRAEVPQNRAVPASTLRPQDGYAQARLGGQDTRSLAQHYAQPGESAQAAAGRLDDAAQQFVVHQSAVSGSLRAVSGAIPFLSSK